MIRLTISGSMVSVCLPPDDFLQHLPSYLGFSYLGHGVSLHGCSSKAQLLLLTLDEGYLLTAALPDLQHGIAPLGPPTPAQPLLLMLLLLAAGPGLGHGWLLPAAVPSLGLRMAQVPPCSGIRRSISCLFWSTISAKLCWLFRVILRNLIPKNLILGVFIRMAFIGSPE